MARTFVSNVTKPTESCWRCKRCVSAAAIVAAVSLGVLPAVSLVAVLPSLLLVKPVQWAIGDVSQPVPIPALGANVVWNLATNTLVALTFIVAMFLRT